MARVLPDETPPIRPHELRHTYGTHLKRQGVDIFTIQKIMGHKDIEMTTELYVHSEEEMLTNDLKKTMPDQY